LAAERAAKDTAQPLTEAHDRGILADIAVNAAYNNSRQRTGLDVKLGTTTLHTAAYTHDPAGRLQAVSSSDYSATYTYQPNSLLLDTVTFKNGQDTRLVTTRQYD
jgi:predicted ATPase